MKGKEEGGAEGRRRGGGVEGEKIGREGGEEEEIVTHLLPSIQLSALLSL